MNYIGKLGLYEYWLHNDVMYTYRDDHKHWSRCNWTKESSADWNLSKYRTEALQKMPNRWSFNPEALSPVPDEVDESLRVCIDYFKAILGVKELIIIIEEVQE